MSISDILELSGIILTGMWVLLKYVFKIDKKNGIISKELDNLSGCFISFSSDTKDYMNKTDNKIDNIKDTLSSHASNLAVINGMLGINISEIMGKNSPRKLKPAGIKIYNAVHGDKFLADNKTVLFETIDSMKPPTKLDVERSAWQALLLLSNKPAFYGIKDIVYEMPEIKLGNGKELMVTINDVCLALSIPLRDMYLAEKWQK